MGKRTRPNEDPDKPSIKSSNLVDTRRPTVIAKPRKHGVRFSVSIGLPGSIIQNAQGLERKTILAGMIARAAAIFCITEIIIFNETPMNNDCTKAMQLDSFEPNEFLLHILQYLETPQYLRKQLFPLHPNLRFAGLLPSLDIPHHLRADERLPFREGIISHIENEDIFVNVGLTKDVRIDGKGISNLKLLEPLTRVTIELNNDDSDNCLGSKKSSYGGKRVKPNIPRKKAGLYWGYDTRYASSLSAVFAESPYKKGYDLAIGFSERGTPLTETLQSAQQENKLNFKHLLLMFGGVSGLEAAADADHHLSLDGSAISLLFDYWINIASEQGSRTIRTEEALFIALAQMQEWVGKGGIK